MVNNSRTLQERLNDCKTTLVYRWRFIAMFAAAMFALLFLVVHFLPNTYESTTTILLYPQRVPEKYVTSTVIEDSNDRLNMLQQEILSTTRLNEVIDKFGLYPKLIQQDGRNAAVELMRKAIKIQIKHTTGSGSSAFTLTYSGDEPKLVAKVTNELADSFIAKNLANRQQQVQGTTDFLNDELESARKDLEAQEAKLRDYRMSHLGEMPDQMPGNLQAIAQQQAQYQSISDQLARLDQEKLLIENAPEADPVVRGAMRAGSGSGSAASGGTGSATSAQISIVTGELEQERNTLAGLLTHETDQHPDVIAHRARVVALEHDLSKLTAAQTAANAAKQPDTNLAAADGGESHLAAVRLEVLNKERAHLLEEQARAEARMNGYQSKVDVVPLRQEQMSGLTRDYETARDQYRSLLEKHYSAQMASELESKQDAERFEVLDPAVPAEHPTSPNRPMLWAASAVMALLAGFVIAFSREQIDVSVKSESELRKIMPGEIEILGVIGNISKRRLPKEPKLLQVG